LHIYVILWIATAIIFSREYIILNGNTGEASFFESLNRTGFFGETARKANLDPAPGKPLSFMLGWIGFLVICMTNLYILRKHLPQWQKYGNITRWLDFHIFCGLLGPTIITFHTNFHLNGLVALSYWCMMTSFASGIVGRYFYIQVLRQRAELKEMLKQYDSGFVKLQQKNAKVFTPELIAKAKKDAFAMAGGSIAMLEGKANLFSVLANSVVGDIRMLIHVPQLPGRFPSALWPPLKQYAVTRRRLAASPYFRRLMGYWHSFHLPFAVFMYVVTVIHIASALIFRVNH
jgi:hypothetical protein